MKRLFFAIALLLVGAHTHAQTSDAEVQADLLAIKIAAAVDTDRLADAAKLLDEYATLGVAMPPPLILQRAVVYFKLERFADAEVQLTDYLKKIERGSDDYNRAVLMLAEVKPKAAPEMEARRAAVEAKAKAKRAAEKAKAEAAAKAKRVAAAKAKAAAEQPGRKFRDCEGCPEMVIVPAGSFMMGSPASEKYREDQEGPQHRVKVGKFAVGRYEVTFAEWEACRRAGGCSRDSNDEYGWGKGNRPVINVSWDDAKEYVKWLSKKTGKRYRLLSESEWEYAARAGSTTPYHTGRKISSNQANYGKHHKKTVSVGSYPANKFGLHDMHGNVTEWVEDCWRENYEGAPSDGSAWTTGGDCPWFIGHVVRGGSWAFKARDARAAKRTVLPSVFRLHNIGFRVARTLTP